MGYLGTIGSSKRQNDGAVEKGAKVKPPEPVKMPPPVKVPLPPALSSQQKQ